VTSRQLPAIAVADLLGVNAQTALRWAFDTRPDWSAYLDARTQTSDSGGCDTTLVT